ncbi:efflux RND transporter periplasmic adaptor subunit [Fusobacterium gastrosuis]|uniref:efflux RND transporter periplasmic adaptor subunit n=4 Tax=Fusobacterium TaxID=848 RepID=UPI0029759AC2|nr:efflux RND transporter periplasmic adaptor subunit [Fusobacteriaceae bacterium]MDY5713068.1 efflux RND transporter periplasmic adaptor subunit [Fusobacterium gastrosuis]
MKRILGLILATSLFIIACGKKEEKVVEEKKIVKIVELGEVKEKEMSKLFESSITLQPKDKINHSTEKGGTVEKIYKTNGDFVRKGELVVEFSDPTTKALYLQASANYQSAKAAFDIARANYEKFKVLFNKQLISFLEFSQYESSFINARGSLEVAQASLQSAKNDYDKLTRRADTDGVVANLFVKVGNKVAAQETVFTVLNDSEIEAYVGVPAEAISKVNKGDTLKVRVAALNKEYDAVITELNPIADATTKNFQIKLSLDNVDKAIKDGMYGDVVINIGKTTVLVIEDEAIFVRDLLNYVYKYDTSTKKIHQVEVKTGMTNLPYTEITSNEIKVGDKIVVKGLFGLQDNDEVEVKNEVNN